MTRRKEQPKQEPLPGMEEPELDVKPLGIAPSHTPEDMFSSIQALEGSKIEYLRMLPAEVTRQVSQYAIMRIRRGKRTIRLIVLMDVVNRPCPNDLDMWNFLEFFEPEEIKARRMNQPLELPRWEEKE